MLRIVVFKRWLAIGTLVLLMSVVSLAKPKDNNGKKGCGPHDKCAQMPDGGSAPAYLLIAGSSCLAAMAVRARLNKSRLA